MHCPQCGHPLEADGSPCTHCGAQQVQVLPPAERDGFEGVTIQSNQEGPREETEPPRQQRVFYYHYQPSSRNPLGSIWVILLGLAVAAGIFFFVLPVLLFLIVAAGAGWLLRFWLRRR